MREILFRGKTDKGEWVQGVPFFEEYRCYIIEDLFICDEYNCTGAVNSCVIPETIGQYTGLTDKNGKKIFEGDILKIARVSDSIGSYYYPPLAYPVNVIVKWDMCAWMWETLCEDKRYIGFPDAWCHYECEIIGNIHDNPELLKGE